MKAFSPTGQEIVATADLIPGNAWCDVLGRKPDGSLEIGYLDETKVCWDGQHTTKDERGQSLFVAADGTEWPEDSISLEGEALRPMPAVRPVSDRDAVAVLRGIRADNPEFETGTMVDHADVTARLAKRWPALCAVLDNSPTAPSPATVTVWTLTTDGDNMGIGTQAFASEADALGAARDVLRTGYKAKPMPDNLDELGAEALSDLWADSFDGACIIESHQVAAAPPAPSRGLEFDNQEAAIILAGLRMLQRVGVQDQEDDIASDGGQFEPLGDDAIDELCERINGPVAPSPDWRAIAADLAAALDSCTHQIGQMRGIFPDDDGSIRNAVTDAGFASDRYAAAAAIQPGAPMPAPTVAVIVDCGSVETVVSEHPDMIGRPILIVDFDVDDVPDSELVEITPPMPGKSAARVLRYLIEKPLLDLGEIEEALKAKAS